MSTIVPMIDTAKDPTQPIRVEKNANTERIRGSNTFGGITI
jgi:hypothetical protein